MGTASNILVTEDQWCLLGIALHASELPAEAVALLRENFPDAEDKATGNFYFLTVALPFGFLRCVLGCCNRVFGVMAPT